MSSFVHGTSSASGDDTECRLKGRIDHAANNGTAIAYGEKVYITHNYYHISDPPSKGLVPADAELEHGAPTVAENPAPGRAVSSSAQANGLDSAFTMSPKMKRHLDSLLKAVEKASIDSKQESDRQRPRWRPSPMHTHTTSLPVPDPPQTESASGNLTLEEELKILSPRMKNYLKRLGNNQEGTLADEFEKFYQVGFSSGYNNSDIASLFGAFQKDLQTLSPRMQEHITALMTR